MTLSLAIALNAIADVTLLGGLAWLMSRPTKLTPHLSARHDAHRFAVIHGGAQQAESHDRIAA